MSGYIIIVSHDITTYLNTKGNFFKKMVTCNLRVVYSAEKKTYQLKKSIQPCDIHYRLETRIKASKGHLKFNVTIWEIYI